MTTSSLEKSEQLQAKPPLGARKPVLVDGVWRDGPYWFDIQSAKRIVDFCRKCITHHKGEWAGLPLILEPWQKEIVEAIFGWKRPDDTRRFRTAYVEVGRKNGKSTLASAIAAYLLFADKEPGAEIYSAAADRSQAAIVFESAKAAVEASPSLSKRCKIYRRSIVVPETKSSYKVLSADVETKHGLSPSGIIFDELHAQPNRRLWDTLKTGMSSRRQPLLLAITTAGFDRHSICYEQHLYAEKVNAGIIEDPEFFGVIYAAAPEDDWTSEAAWLKANPNLGVSKKLFYMRTECNVAKETPAYENTFRQFELCQWTEQSVRWLPMEAWDRCNSPVVRDDLEGEDCWGGLDLSTTSDIAVFALLFKNKDGPGYKVLPFFWVPEDNAERRERRDKVPYKLWIKAGLIKATEGDVIDYDVIREDIKELGEHFHIQEIACDRWNAAQIITQLEKEGFTIFPFGQGFASMAFPTKRLMEIVLNKDLAHNGHPVLRWMASNVAVKKDEAGNQKPDKEKSTEKIDGIVATIMALARAEVSNKEADDWDGEIFTF